MRPLQNEELFAFGPVYERLVAPKNRYDPTNVFRLNANIQPTQAQAKLAQTFDKLS